MSYRVEAARHFPAFVRMHARLLGAFQAAVIHRAAKPLAHSEKSVPLQSEKAVFPLGNAFLLH